MKKFVCLMMAVMVVLSIFAGCVSAEGTFDYTVLSKLDGYEYDKFTKCWSYYAAYRETYSDAYVIIGMKIYGEDGGANPEYAECYVKILDKSGNSLRTVDSITFLVDDTLFTYETMMPGETASSVIIGEQSVELIKALAKATSVSVKIGHNRGNTTIDLDQSEFESTLKSFCKTWVRYDFYKYVSEDNMNWIRSVESWMPLEIVK